MKAIAIILIAGIYVASIVCTIISLHNAPTMKDEDEEDEL